LGFELAQGFFFGRPSAASPRPVNRNSDKPAV
jgi:hypothetical protein